MEFVDDRTDKQRKTHTLIVLGTDSFLSGWGGAGKGPSYAGWTSRPDNVGAVENWVRCRGDMKRVRVVGNDYRVPNIEGHCHFYVVDLGHASIRRPEDALAD